MSSKASVLKAKFRQSKKWKEFRDKIIKQQRIEPISRIKLRKGCVIHHLDQRAENYKVLEDERLIALQPKSHEMIHYLYGYYIKDKEVLNRIKDILDKMIEYSTDDREEETTCGED